MRLGAFLKGTVARGSLFTSYADSSHASYPVHYALSSEVGRHASRFHLSGSGPYLHGEGSWKGGRKTCLGPRVAARSHTHMSRQCHRDRVIM